jgi:hypothetical protein
VARREQVHAAPIRGSGNDAACSTWDVWRIAHPEG